MEQVFGIENVVVVDVDGSPTGRKEHLVWNPPRIDDRDVKQGRVSTIAETSRIFRFLLDRGIRAIVFCKVSFNFVLFSLFCFELTLFCFLEFSSRSGKATM